MSRNFALLQIVGKEQEYFQSESAASAPKLVAVPPPPTKPEPLSSDFIARQLLDRQLLNRQPLDPQPLRFEMEAWKLEELTKLVRAIFLGSETDFSRSALNRTSCNRTVVFASSESGNGASWICARAGELLASQVTGRVCLVDANLDRPILHELFGVPNHHGLAEALRKEDSIGGYISQLSRRNLVLVSAGSGASAGSPDTKNRNLDDGNLDRDLSRQAMRRRLQELRAEFDYVLVDAASLDAGNSAIALADLADGIVLVLKTHSTRRERLRRRLQDMKSAGVRILGTVLNQPAC